jgi:hypothetical protein
MSAEALALSRLQISAGNFVQSLDQRRIERRLYAIGLSLLEVIRIGMTGIRSCVSATNCRFRNHHAAQTSAHPHSGFYGGTGRWLRHRKIIQPDSGSILLTKSPLKSSQLNPAAFRPGFLMRGSRRVSGQQDATPNCQH